jgi:hypothetical protein
VEGLLFDVERNGFWWHAWGSPPDEIPERLAEARERLSEVPRLTPLWSNLFLADTDDSPVFSIEQADLYVPALTLPDLITQRSEDSLDPTDYPIGAVPFWSELHAYSQIGHMSAFGELADGGL